MKSSPSLFSLSFGLVLYLQCFQMVPFCAEASKKLHIVYMEDRQHEDANLVPASHHDMLASITESKEEAINSIVYSYRHGFSGFAAMLTESQAKKIGELPEVIRVRLSRSYQLHTTRSWNFLGVNDDQPNGLLGKANYGDGVIVGVIDTGIWPESRSFNDEGYEPIPSRWKGICQTGQAFGSNNCTRKIIGARWYAGGVDAADLDGEFLSPRDLNGHGTHTASTAAGNRVNNVSFNGLGAGMAMGGAPRARLAIYKACWGVVGRCNDAAVLKAIDDAIHDGVDIISLSISGNGHPSASLQAVMKGISVVFSGGNDGPAPQTVANDLPWVLTVAASTLDRSFPTIVTLGNGQRIVGQSIFYGPAKDANFTELVDGASCSRDDLNSTNIIGKVVLCYPLNVPVSIPRVDLPIAVSNVLQAGGKGLIFAMYTTNLLESTSRCKGIACVVVDFQTSYLISDYMATTSTPVVKVTPTHNVFGKEVLAPKVAAFSSRGPSAFFPSLLKPDIATPGVSILAAVGNSYKFNSGTSMACPHATGVLALLKSIHSDWSPAALKSAIITTASITDGYGAAIQAEAIPRKLADPFDFGGGHINPNRANDPGLVYDIDPKEYLEFFNCTFGPTDSCSKLQNPLYNLNLPSIAVPDLKRNVTVWRTVTNVGNVSATYKAVIESPAGVGMFVEPSVLNFNAASRVQRFKVIFTASRKVQGVYTFGSLAWDDGKTHSVRIPIAIQTVIQDFYADVS